MYWLCFSILIIHVIHGSNAAECQTQFLGELQSRYSDVAFTLAVTPADSNYDDLRRHANNLRHICDASYIVFPKEARDVVNILRVAMKRNLRPTVRSGSHCYEDFWANNTGGVLIDMSAMTKMTRESGDTIIWAESGASLQLVYSTLYKHFGLTVPAGVCLDIAIGGLTLGGGFGYLVRHWGLLIDYVEGFEIARINQHKEVELVTVGRNSRNKRDQDLFWALRGAGSQAFGVVTKIGFRDLPQSPPLVYVYESKFNFTVKDKRAFIDIMDKYGKFLVAHGNLGDEFCDMYTDVAPTRQANVTFLQVRMIIVGKQKQYLADRFLDAIGLDTKKFTCEISSFYRILVLWGWRDDTWSDSYYYIQRSAFMHSAFTQKQLEAMWNAMIDRADHPNFKKVAYGYVTIQGWACAVSRFAENETAFAHRKAKMIVQFGTVWGKWDEAEPQIRWSRDFYYWMYGSQGPKPDAVNDGAYYNYPDRDLVDWPNMYFKDNYERLMKVKTDWDPLNIFYHRQSIQVAKNNKFRA